MQIVITISPEVIEAILKFILELTRQ